MRTIESKIIIAGIFFIGIILSGIWLSKTGKPYHVGIFSLHKLVSITTIILIGKVVFNLQKEMTLQTIELVLILLTGVFFIAIIVTGAIQSINESVNGIIPVIHKITPFFVAAFCFVTIYRLYLEGS